MKELKTLSEKNAGVGTAYGWSALTTITSSFLVDRLEGQVRIRERK
jgi:hypothetical protein